jgi:hypothetical protein
MSHRIMALLNDVLFFVVIEQYHTSERSKEDEQLEKGTNECKNRK